jgi:hypothetical protein
MDWPASTPDFERAQSMSGNLIEWIGMFRVQPYAFMFHENGREVGPLMVLDRSYETDAQRAQTVSDHVAKLLQSHPSITVERVTLIDAKTAAYSLEGRVNMTFSSRPVMVQVTPGLGKRWTQKGG